MQAHGNFFYLKLILLFGILTTLLSLAYTVRLRGLVESYVLHSVQETAEHDKRAIQTILEFFLDELDGVGKRLELNGPKEVQALKKRLEIESASTFFTKLYLLSEDGKVYSAGPEDSRLARVISRTGFHNLFRPQAPESMVLRLDTLTDAKGAADSLPLNAMAGEYLLYAQKLKNVRIAGQRMVGLIGLSELKFLRDHLITKSFVTDGVANGVSALLDLDGNILVGESRDAIVDKGRNFFALLAQAKHSSLGSAQVQAMMLRHESFSLNVDFAGEKKLLYLVPFSGAETLDWYFLISVNNELILERQTAFTLLCLALLGMVVLVLSLLMLYAMFTQQRLSRAQEAVRVRSEFLSNMSHEIRTPLNGIIGLNYLISSHIGEAERLSQIKNWLGKSRSLADYLLSLLNDILDMSKLQAGKIDIVAKPFSLAALLDDVWLMQSSNAKGRGTRLIVEKDLPWPALRGDERRIKQVLTNIVGNAVKFTPSGGEIRLKVSQEQLASGQVQTSFSCFDTGIGMSQEFLKRIFDPFAQEHNSAHGNSIKGTGLGMPITRELVTAMAGSIEVASELGKGTTFLVRLPLDLASAAEREELGPVLEGTLCELDAPEERSGEAQAFASAYAPRLEARTATAGGTEAVPGEQGERALKILLAEDAEFNAEFLMELLSDEGFAVVHAENGQVALDIFRSSGIGEFDIILMDMQMPVLDGCAAASAIRGLSRADARTVRIYACTANTFREDMERAMASGMDDFLTKPIDIKVFLQKLKTLGHKTQAAANAG